MSNTLLTLQELLSGTKGTLIGARENCEFTSVQTDSRNVVNGTLFVPLVGEFQNGHKYIPQALEKGATVVLLNNSEFDANKDLYQKLADENPDVAFVIVENTLHGLQDAAEAYVSKFPGLTKISITGSCGKTTTKEMLVSVFKAKYGDKVVYTQGNFNSETGLPLSVFNIRANHEIGIFEMGMNRVDEIGEISKVLKSQYGIITNIGTAHIGILGSRENIATEKRKSFNYIPAKGAAFVPVDDDFASFCTKNVAGKVVKFGRDVPEKKDGVIFIEDNGLFGTKFSLEGVEINLPLSGEYNYQNALGVVACARELGLTPDEIKQGLENMAAVSGRMESKKITLKNGAEVILIKDCYNANPDSMSKVIDFCGTLKNVGKKIFVLGDMKELGAVSETAHTEIGKKVAEEENCFTIFVGSDMEAAYKVACNGKSECMWEAENNADAFAKLADKINTIAKAGDVILLKGSHSMALENLIPEMVKEDAE